MTPDSPRKPIFKQGLAVALVLAVGLVLGAFILADKKPAAGADAHGHDTPAEAADEKKGPHGGRLFASGNYGLELTIFETGTAPHFRIYTYNDGKPLDPAHSQVVVDVERLGRAPQRFAFGKEGAFLKADALLQEPHSFAVVISALHAGKTHQFKFEQVEARVTMSDAQLQSNGVQLATAGPARITTRLQLLGEVRLNEDSTVHVVPRLTGLVQAVSANAGDRVRRGQLLAVLSSPTLADQRSEWLAAQQRLGLARTTFEREKRLWEARISAEQDYLQARLALQETEIAEQAARQKLAALGVATAPAGQLTRYEIRAPVDGVITDKKISVGEVLKEDTRIFTVADLSTVWVEMAVYAKDVNAVKPGQQVTVKAASFEARAEGRIGHVGALVGEQTRAAMARVVLPNPQGWWRPGLPVNVELTAEETDVALAVATEAVQSLGQSPVVFGRYGQQFEARPLLLGRSDGRMTEVLGGLLPGERYAARNSYLIKADIGKAGASHNH